MPISESLQPCLAIEPPEVWLISGVVGGALLVLALLGLWLFLGRGPRRGRAFRRAEQLLRQGDWQQALAIAQKLQQGSNPPRWQSLLVRLEGECHRAAGDAALRDKQYEAALETYLRAADLLNRASEKQTRPDDVRAYVVETMLAEVRRLFSEHPQTGTEPVHQLIRRTLAVQSPCPEASFWEGLCLIRDGKPDAAAAALVQARGGDAQPPGPPGTTRPVPRALPAFIDPPLYLGALHLREGRADEAVRYLAEANRLDAGCPFVTWQLGTALLAAGGDTLIAVRALQRALGPRGLLLWVKNPQRAWVEAFPDKRSYVRKLAAQYPFPCPLFGGDLGRVIRLGRITLGQGLYWLGDFEESARIFKQLLEESAPTLPVLRGLGLALARLDRFDEAFKHLRAAHDLENPKNYLTAGYLALCGALGRPTNPEDKPRNVAWAVQSTGRFRVPANPEWAGLLNRIFAEARAIDLPVAREDQQRLADTLASVAATDPLAAAAYAHLAATHPDAVLPEYAWLYCRAAQEHGFSSAQDLDLFARTFATEAEARPYYEQHGWDLGEVEYTYLARCAAQRPGAFPEGLGPDYPARGERLLLTRSERLEQSGDAAGAVTSAEVLLTLAPGNVRAHDRLAQLAYRAGDLDRAAELLEGWQRLAPADPLPLVRRAVVEQQRGKPARRAEAIRQALTLARGPARAEAAFVGARLALEDWLRHPADSAAEAGRNGDGGGPPFGDPGRQALDLLRECLADDPGHEAGLWCLAAALETLHRPDELAALAPAVRRREDAGGPLDARFHFLSAVGHLAARDYPRVIESAGRAAALSPELGSECAYLEGWARWLLGDADGAAAALEEPARDEAAAARPYAQALLGQVAFSRGAGGAAVGWWKALDPALRAAWGLEEPLRATLFADALQAFHEGRFEEAAEKYREAGRFGLRDRRLGPLLALALLRAGQEMLFR